MAKPEELKSHKLLLESLSQIKSVKSIKLVSRLYDERIGNSNPKRIYIFFPDMHIISRAFKKEKGYKYGFNHERTFVELLLVMLKLKTKQTDYSLSVCQLGDFVDLWREGVTDPTQMLIDFQGVRDYLYALGMRRSLNARFLLGNHDIDMVTVQKLSTRWHFRLFLPNPNRPKIYVTHGDVFDWIEKLPDSLQEWAVYHFSPKEKKPPKNLKKMIELKKSEDVRLNFPVVTSSMEDVKNQDVLKDDRYNISNHKYLEKCLARAREINKKFNVSLTAAVIGHTHDAGIAIMENNDEFFVLMDCGAWYGKYREGASALKPNCQLGVICGNDLRIYQLDPDPNKSPQFESSAVI